MAKKVANKATKKATKKAARKPPTKKARTSVQEARRGWHWSIRGNTPTPPVVEQPVQTQAGLT
jgi:hypothetical protein